jgi:hypothetical protein
MTGGRFKGSDHKKLVGGPLFGLLIDLLDEG